MEKNLKVILVTLIVILLTLVSFVGIYTKKTNVSYENILANYLFSSNLEGKRVIELAVDTSTEEVVYDKDGNIVEETSEESTESSENTDSTSQNDEEEYTTVNEPVNPEENLTLENYKLSKKIIEKRLKQLNSTDYVVRLNEENGNIIVEMPENAETDEIVSYLNSIGNFEMLDEETHEVLLSEKDIKNVLVAYNTTSTGTSVYLNIEFNKEVKNKLEEITNKYISTTDEEGNTVTKNVTLKMENEELFSTYFNETISNGQIQLTIGNSATDTETIENYLKNAAAIAILLNNGKMPLIYNIESEQFVKPVVNDSILAIGIYVLVGLAIISFIYLILKYKKYGALAVISSIFALDLLLLAIRYTNVYLSIESAVAFIILIILNIYIIKNLLKNINKNSDDEEISKSLKNGFIASIDMIIVLLIISIVFTFIRWSAINTLGILMFWGIICIMISHLILTKILLSGSNK